MKKKIFVGLCVAFCLGAGVLVAGHVAGVSVLNMNNIESLAACEVFDSYGNELGGCRGNEGQCFFDNVSCKGTEYRN